MKSTDPKFQQMIDEIRSFIGRRVEKEWVELFGGAVLVTIPRSCEAYDLDVTGWVNPNDEGQAEDLLPRCFFNLAVTMMAVEDVDPVHLHGLVMRAAAACGKALVIDISDDDGMVKN